MGRKSNLRKKFGRLKIRDKDEAGTSNNRPTRDEDGERSRRSIVGNVHGEDRISNLPDRVLGDILSRLDFEEAVRTCILSRDWMNKWTHISNVKLCDGLPCPKNNFLNFVKGVFNKVLCIKEFTLLCLHSQDPSQVKEIISDALDSPVLESLSVILPETNTYFRPSSFYSKSLVKLELFSCDLRVSAKVCFSHLRFLTLCGLEIKNQEVSSSSRLLFMMPILEEFKLQGCKFLNVKSLKIRSPMLSCLEVIDCKYESEESLDGTYDQYVIEISSGRNINFTYRGDLEENFAFSNGSAISNASLSLNIGDQIFFACQNFLKELASRARILLEKFSSSLTKLELSENVIMVLSNWQPPFPLPMFDNLKKVEVPLLWFVNHCLHTSGVDLLKNAIVLETLAISSGDFRLSRKCDKCKSKANSIENSLGRRSLPSLPSNFLTHLKSVEFQIFHGLDGETQLVKFLLLFAPVLEELKIVCKDHAVANKLEKQVKTFRTASGASGRLTMYLLPPASNH